MKKEALFLLILLVVVAGCSEKSEHPVDTIILDNSVDEIKVKVEIVDSFEERQQGLMFREKLGKNDGMLFIFEEEATYPFWMKNTLIPLDMIWIDSNLEVVDVQTAVPCVTEQCVSYAPGAEALYVLEVNAGFAEDRNIGLGTRMIWDGKY